MMWLVFADERVRELCVDWEAAYCVALFRSQAGPLLSRPEFVELVDRMHDSFPEFAALWQRRDITPFVPATRRFHHPEFGKIEFDYVKMYAADEDRTLVANLVHPGSDLAERLSAAVERLSAP